MGNRPIFILGIESSCDDTSAAVSQDTKILSNVIAGQEVHRLYGGVVPELASRAHQQNIVPVVDAALNKAGIKKEELSAVAFTRGPGLLGSLLVGTSFAKAFALGLKIPLLEINHMQAHILAHFITAENKTIPSFPFICLTVSGGHTQLVLVRSHTQFEVIGETIDDAAGEAFDKAAKILGLPYPGGPLIDAHAKKGKADAYRFPISKMPDLLYFIEAELKKNPQFVEQNLNDICASIQYTIIASLMVKLKKAMADTGIKTVALAGGVSANSGLRKAVQDEAELQQWTVFIPAFEYCTDNAAMIAVTGYYKFLRGEFSGQDIAPAARYIL
jgi:N6-L-threonylcarbamoyladenine synthase